MKMATGSWRFGLALQMQMRQACSGHSSGANMPDAGAVDVETDDEEPAQISNVPSSSAKAKAGPAAVPAKHPGLPPASKTGPATAKKAPAPKKAAAPAVAKGAPAVVEAAAKAAAAAAAAVAEPVPTGRVPVPTELERSGRPLHPTTNAEDEARGGRRKTLHGDDGVQEDGADQSKKKKGKPQEESDGEKDDGNDGDLDGKSEAAPGVEGSATMTKELRKQADSKYSGAYHKTMKATKDKELAALAGAKAKEEFLAARGVAWSARKTPKPPGKTEPMTRPQIAQAKAVKETSKALKAKGKPAGVAAAARALAQTKAPTKAKAAKAVGKVKAAAKAAG